jgi:imidazolonepropionase-like amidohydrolase
VGVFALRAARLFDGDQLLTPPVVLIESGAIVAAGTAIPDSTPVLDLADGTLLPGLIDCHQHLCFDGNGTLESQVAGVGAADLVARARAAAERALGAGITTLRDLGDRDFATLSLKGDPALPTILPAGPPITRSGGHCWFLGGACQGHTELSRAVADRSDRQCDVVKVMATGGYLTPTFPMWEAQFQLEELRTVVDQAHRLSLPVAAHCHGIVGIEQALDTGADSIEHCTFYTPAARPEPTESLLTRLASSPVVISATLGRLPGHPYPPNVINHQATLQAARRRLVELGATVVVGSDAGISAAKPHDVLPYAFADLIESGMSPIEGLRTLTAGAARACGVAERKGRLAAGFEADVVAVAGDPLRDPAALRSVTGVWRAGQRVC